METITYAEHKMKLFFTRHGESQANIERIISNRDRPHSLTAKGRTQAAFLAEQLVPEPITAIYASPILRAQETAQIIAQRVGAPIYTNDALREFDCGCMEGRGDAEAWTAHHTVVAAWANHDYAQCIPGGESFTDMQARFVPFVQQLIEAHGQSDTALLLIGHGSLLMHMLPLVVSNLEQTFIDQQGMRNCIYLRTVVKDGQLFCAQWDDQPLA